MNTQSLPAIDGNALADTFFADTATSRDEQVEIVFDYLKKSSESNFDAAQPGNFSFGAAHAQQAWIANTMASFIRTEDNSIRGFVTRFTAIFRADD